MQSYTPDDVFADIKVWCGDQGDLRSFWPDDVWYVLQGEVFGRGQTAQLPYCKFKNQSQPGLRIIAYDAAGKRVCAVGMFESQSQTDWELTYYFAISGARNTRVLEIVLPTVSSWSITRAAALHEDITLQGEVACTDDGCKWDFAYRATPQGQLFTRDDVSHC